MPAGIRNGQGLEMGDGELRPSDRAWNFRRLVREQPTLPAALTAARRAGYTGTKAALRALLLSIRQEVVEAQGPLDPEAERRAVAREILARADARRKPQPPATPSIIPPEINAWIRNWMDRRQQMIAEQKAKRRGKVQP